MTKRSVARAVDPKPEPATKEPTATAGLTDALYETLRALGCVKCEACGGSYMLPEHTQHLTLFDPLLVVEVVEVVEAEVAP